MGKKDSILQDVGKTLDDTLAASETMENQKLKNAWT